MAESGIGQNGAVPDVLDMLVVGGGPAGTAAAFRAKELGLTALVIDYDDLMKRIRDYAKGKDILPNFGGGDKMQFPKGGDLIKKLHFSPIDKDDMHLRWKGFYQKSGVVAHVGVELLGLEWADPGLWQVKTWNHKAKAEQTYRARHVVIAIGRGVPRRFDIPGNTDGVAYRLADAQRYVGAPVCVVGGGTSAAEAVIAISQAKAEAGDACAVYWSYRGDKMPRVSKALAEAFFEAYVGNGNIRYYPRSEPAAVVTGVDREEYLSIRVDRKVLGGRPIETAHLEFSKAYCVACIGEDIPEGFLNSLGIEMATGGPNNKKRMVVTPLLETRQPNVYLIGDILSQAYLETDDFDADPAKFREIKHRGNIKAALREGVFVAEVIKQKLDGRSQIDVTLEYEPDTGETKGVAEKMDSFLHTIVETEAPPEESTSPERAAVVPAQARLVRMTQSGVDAEEFPLKPDGVTTLGRKGSDISFSDDTLLSDSHASISHQPEGYFLRDDASQTGTFLRAWPARPLPLSDGALLRMGRQFLVFQVKNGAASFTRYNHKGNQMGHHPLAEGTIVIGRKAPDIILDDQDMVLSRRHLAISLKGGIVLVKDLKSLNGTYIRVRDAVRLEPDDVFTVGRQMFRFSAAEAPVARRASFVVKPLVVPPAAPKPAPEAAAPVVEFRKLGKTVSLKAGQTLCDAAEAAGLDLNAECHAGICGSDPVRIISGAEHLNELGDEEAETLEDLCGLKPGECRLACMTRASGPVVVEFIEQ